MRTVDVVAQRVPFVPDHIARRKADFRTACFRGVESDAYIPRPTESGQCGRFGAWK